MPTYEYACTSCGEHVEVVQSFRDDPLTTCPACGGPLRKVFGSIGVVFKGSGFYKNDSRPAAKESATSKEPATSTDSKPAASEASGSSKEASGSSKEKSKEKTSSSDGSSGSSGDKSSPKSGSPSGKSDGSSGKSSAAAS